MRKGGGKPKGNSFENKMAKEMSRWITQGRRFDVFDRNPSSGAKATMHKKTGGHYANQTGDIVSLDDDGFRLMKHFVLECKHYKEINIPGPLYRTKGGIPGWWKKVKMEAFDVDREPMLLMKQNNRPILLGLTFEGIEILELEKHIALSYPQDDLHILQFNTFLNHADPAVLLINHTVVVSNNRIKRERLILRKS